MTSLSRRRSAAAAATLLGTLLAASAPAHVSGQVVWDDLTVTGGFAVESYNGNFSAVTVPVVDSTDHAAAAVGEFGATGRFRVPAARLTVAFDMGMRQFAATGFELRDYAPREWVGRLDAGWMTGVWDAGTLNLTGTVRGRDIEDRPPMPLFLQPGYESYGLGALFRSRLVQDVRFDVSLDTELTDYQAPELLPQLDLLDRRSWGVEAGASFGPLASDPGMPGWSLRFHAGYRRSEFRDQTSGVAADPYRRDGTVQVGGTWSYEGPVFAEVGMEGTVNRSNSRRPAYDALSVRSAVSAALPWWDLGANLLAVYTGKTYVHEVPFILLVPGEEADNASIVYLDVNRPLTTDLDGALRFGWTRAETDIGDAYYSRFGVTFHMIYRPPGL